MQQAKVVVKHEAGLHARPASLFVKLAKQFSSDIKITSNGKTVSAKSLVLIITLAVQPNTEIEVRAEGSDEQEAIAALVGLVERNFTE
ncbi:MAG TPA: HPr family phosphocarrier protein [Ktedonobacteraceae bacterium]|nr:HPr family phosphocarrier protein [Ktedonobacteraceae bacterium]